MFGNFIMALSRGLMLLAVIASLVSGAVMIVISFAGVLKGAWNVLQDRHLDVEVMRTLAVDVIEVADAMLLGVVMLLIALGLYQLFIDPRIAVPGWMRVTSLSDLKENLVAVTIVLLGISFLSRVVHWDGEKEIIYFGVAIAAVLVPLVAVFALFSVTNSEDSWLRRHHRGDARSEVGHAPATERQDVPSPQPLVEIDG